MSLLLVRLGASSQDSQTSCLERYEQHWYCSYGFVESPWHLPTLTCMCSEDSSVDATKSHTRSRDLCISTEGKAEGSVFSVEGTCFRKNLATLTNV